MAAEEYNTPTFLYCFKCKRTRNTNEFHKRRRSKTGFQSACKECHGKVQLKSRSTRREEIRAKNNLYYLKTKDKKRRYHQEHIEERKEYDRQYAIKNAEKCKAKDKRKRARKLGATLEIFTDIEIFTRDKWICQLCNKKVNKKLKYPHPLSASLDHVIPLSKGGAHSRQNCCLAHLQCNNIKQNRSKVQQQRLF